MTLLLSSDESCFIKYVENGCNKEERTALLQGYRGKTLKEIVSVADRVKAFFVGKNSQIQKQNEEYLQKWYRKWLDKTISIVTFGKCSLKRQEYDLHSIYKAVDKVVLAYEKIVVLQVQQKQKENTSFEESRLKSEGLLPNFAIQSLQELVKKAKVQYQLQSTIVKDMSLLAGHAQEIKRIYQDTHYVFTHAQSLDLSVVNETIHEFIKIFHKKHYHPFFVPFRLPEKRPLNRNIDEFFERARPDSLAFSDMHYSRELLSADSFFWSTELEESALYYLLRASNVNQTMNANVVQALLGEIVETYIPNCVITQRFAQRLAAVGVRKKQESKIGALWTICVPKGVVENPQLNIVYRAHPFGKRCVCYPKQHMQVLQGLQLDALFRCQTGQIPQYRLLALRLLEEKGTRSFATNTLSKELQKRYRDEVANIVKECCFYKDFFDLQAMMSYDMLQRKMEEFRALRTQGFLDAVCLRELISQKGPYIPQLLQDEINSYNRVH